MSHQKQEVSGTISGPKSEAKETSGKLVPSLHGDSREGSLTDSQLCQLVENDPQTLKLLDLGNKLAKAQPIHNQLDRTEAQFSDTVSDSELIAACEEVSRAQRSKQAIPQQEHWDSSMTDSQLNSAYEQAMHNHAPPPAPAQSYFHSMSDSQILLAYDQVFPLKHGEMDSSFSESQLAAACDLAERELELAKRVSSPNGKTSPPANLMSGCDELLPESLLIGMCDQSINWDAQGLTANQLASFGRSSESNPSVPIDSGENVVTNLSDGSLNRLLHFSKSKSVEFSLNEFETQYNNLLANDQKAAIDRLKRYCPQNSDSGDEVFSRDHPTVDPIHSTPIQPGPPASFRVPTGLSIDPSKPEVSSMPDAAQPTEVLTRFTPAQTRPPTIFPIPAGLSGDPPKSNAPSKPLSHSAIKSIVSGMSTRDQVLSWASKRNLTMHECVKLRLIELLPQTGWGGGRFKCHICQKMFINQSSLTNHVASKHPSDVPKSSLDSKARRVRSPSPPPRPSKRPAHETRTPATNTIAPSPQPDTRPSNIGLSNEDLAILLASKKTTQKVLSWSGERGVLAHQATKDRLAQLQPSEVNNAKESHSCPSCPKSYLHKKDLDRHVQAAHQQISHPCAKGCGRKFNTKSNKTRHENNCSGRLAFSFTCSVCGLGFISLNRLKVHKKVHNNARNIHCLKCNRSFENRTELRAHKISNDCPS